MEVQYGPFQTSLELWNNKTKGSLGWGDVKVLPLELRFGMT